MIELWWNIRHILQINWAYDALGIVAVIFLLFILREKRVPLSGILTSLFVMVFIVYLFVEGTNYWRFQ